MPLSTPPSWARSFYNTFPLRTLPQEDTYSVNDSTLPALWVHPSTSSRQWPSDDPECLRAQLMLAFRGVKYTTRQWPNVSAAPGGELPALQLTTDLLSTAEIRPWVDIHHPPDHFQGLPSSRAYDKGLAIAQVVLNRLRPYLYNSPSLPKPPILAAGLTTPIPAALTGDARSIDSEGLEHEAAEAWDSLEVLAGDGFMLNAQRPTDLDALVAAYAYAAASKLGSKERLEKYVERILDLAEIESRSQPRCSDLPESHATYL